MATFDGSLLELPAFFGRDVDVSGGGGDEVVAGQGRGARAGEGSAKVAGEGAGGTGARSRSAGRGVVGTAVGRPSRTRGRTSRPSSTALRGVVRLTRRRAECRVGQVAFVLTTLIATFLGLRRRLRLRWRAWPLCLSRASRFDVSVASGPGHGTFVEGTSPAAISSAAGRKNVVAPAAALGGFSVAASAGYDGWCEVLVAWRRRHGFSGFVTLLLYGSKFDRRNSNGRCGVVIVPIRRMASLSGGICSCCY